MKAISSARWYQRTAKMTMMASHKTPPLTSSSIVMFMGSSVHIHMEDKPLGQRAL